MHKLTNKYFRNFCTNSNNKSMFIDVIANKIKPKNKEIGQQMLEYERKLGLSELSCNDRINKLIDIMTDKGLKEKYKLKKNMDLIELIEWMETIGLNLLTKPRYGSDNNIIFCDWQWDEETKNQFHDLWLKQSRIPELKCNHPLQYCTEISQNPPTMLFIILPKLTNDSSLMDCFIINYNSLGLIEDIDHNLFPIANELLMLTYCGFHKSTMNSHMMSTLERKLASKMLILLEKNIIDKNLCLDSQFAECFNKNEFDNMNIALQNMIQTIKNYNFNVLGKKYDDSWFINRLNNNIEEKWNKRLIMVDESIETIRKHLVEK